LDTKIHPRLCRGCKVRGESGSHHRPSRRCRIRGNPKTQGRHSRRVRHPRQLGCSISRSRGSENSGRPENSNQGKAGRCGCGATRSHTGRRSRMSIAVGKPKAPAPEAPKDARREATLDSIAGKAGR